MNMKLPLALFLAAAKGVSAAMGSIPLNSPTGLRMMKHARQLENGDGENQSYDTTWMEDYSMKFIGCHHVAQWNSNADDENEVRIDTKRYVLFRLCPTKYCVGKRAVGCSASYGDYVVDMDTFVQAYVETQIAVTEEKCDALAQSCGCNNERNLEEAQNEAQEDAQEDGQDDGNQSCEFQCFYNAGANDCINMEAGDEYGVEFLQEYGACNAYGEGRRHRQLEEEAVQYYIGPYCASNGGEIHMGMFTDDTCTTFADNEGGQYTYNSITGGDTIPYGSVSIVNEDCMSCKESSDNYYNQDGEANLSSVCGNTYDVAGKCETQLHYHLGYDNINENACNWIQGIKVTPIRSNGIIHMKYHGSLKASLIIAAFATVFVMLLFYISYLKSRIAMKKAMWKAQERDNNKNSKKSKSKKMRKRLSFSRLFKRKKSNKEDALLGN